MKGDDIRMWCKNNNKLEKEEISFQAIDVVMNEYNVIRNETKLFFNLQFTVVGIWITLIGVLLGFVFKELLVNADDHTNSLFMKFLLIIILPGASNFLGMIWLDFSMRITKNAFYTYYLENKINKLFKGNVKLLEWEHFKKEDSEKKDSLKLINYFYYFFMMGCFFFVVPLICLFFILIICDFFAIEFYFYLILFIIEVITLFFGIVYVKKILKLDTHDD